MTVQPSDRIAAASICAIAELRAQILAGEHDDHDYVQAMMRHREAECDAIAAFVHAEGIRWRDVDTTGWNAKSVAWRGGEIQAILGVGRRIKRRDHITQAIRGDL